MSKIEDVLLAVPEVKHKKNDGTLYIMKERIAFIVENRETCLASHSFYDIKMQKISPEGKPKIQLQVVLHDGNSSTFHFVNRKGQQQQIADREKVKDLVQKLLPNFKRKIDSELEEKNRVLTENPKLLQLYKDLVISQILTSEEFWKIHGKDLQNLKGNTNKQEIGVSGAFLSEIKPVTDGCNGFKYNLTGEIIECIFKAYPAVKKKHMECVPLKLSESEFWTRFFQSHYFHRDRITAGLKDIFVECGKMDDSTLRKEIRSNLGDPFLDLGKFGDNTIEEGFCSSNTNDQKTDSGGGNIVHQSIIKRFNQHSFMVLKTCQEKAVEVINDDSNKNDEKEKKLNGSSESKKKRKTIEVIEEVPPTIEELAEQQLKKKQKIVEKIQYDDLGNDEVDSSLPVSSNALNLERLERYLYGPTPSSSTVTSERVNKVQEYSPDAVDHMLRNNAKDWGQRVPHTQIINPTQAVNALGDLSPGGLLMRGYQDHNLSQFVPIDFEKEVNNLYLSACELLKEFWSCFPLTTPELEAKAVKMHDTLQRFNMSKVKPFEDRAMRELSPLGTQLVSHINLLIETSFIKFNKSKKNQTMPTDVPSETSFDDFLCNQAKTEYRILFEMKLLMSEFPSGSIYILPNKNHSLSWDGVMFVRSGPFKNGIFRFTLHLESTFPNQKFHPTIKFIDSMTHPLVSPDTFLFDASHAFPTWSENDHIYEILKFLKYAIENVDYCCTQIQNCANQKAVDLYNSDKSKFLEISRETITQSIKSVFNSDNDDDRNNHAFWFDKRIIEDGLHDQIIENMKNSSDSCENLTFSLDRRG
ncbi:CLUMA_CG014898, isoform A [Clunio marinus]|uniref:CLUMA_CG014898, isoform A n=1 Tax=Clunio marinus TaxID=568069 RepID=A0A1J1IN71_9DIPT|nr:CLUMA_CG014898, isoform A [Clunio marinus]